MARLSDADANAQHVLQADEAVYVGGSRPAESYLRGDVILAAAQRAFFAELDRHTLADVAKRPRALPPVPRAAASPVRAREGCVA